MKRECDLAYLAFESSVLLKNITFDRVMTYEGMEGYNAILQQTTNIWDTGGYGAFDDSMFLDNDETENKENLKESALVLSKYFKSKLESSNYQRIGIATRLMQKNYRKHKELRLIKSTNNIDDLKVEDIEEGYYSIISKSLSYLGW